MLSFGDLALFFEASARRVRPELTRETSGLLDGAVKEAQAMIGHELEEWPALAPRTVAEKQARGFTGQISETDPLLRTGKLRDSIERTAEETAAGAEGVLGSSDPVAEYQEMGTPKIPPRPFLAPSMVSAQARSYDAFGHLAVELLTPGVRR